MADGVAPADLYPLDLDRAFKSSTRSSPTSSGGRRRTEPAAPRLGRGADRLLLERPARGTSGRRPGCGHRLGPEHHRRDAVCRRGRRTRPRRWRIAEATSAEGQAAFAAASGYAPINLGSAALIMQRCGRRCPTHRPLYRSTPTWPTGPSTATRSATAGTPCRPSEPGAGARGTARPGALLFAPGLEDRHALPSYKSPPQRPRPRPAGDPAAAGLLRPAGCGPSRPLGHRAGAGLQNYAALLGSDTYAASSSTPSSYRAW